MIAIALAVAGFFIGLVIFVAGLINWMIAGTAPPEDSLIARAMSRRGGAAMIAGVALVAGCVGVLRP